MHKIFWYELCRYAESIWNISVSTRWALISTILVPIHWVSMILVPIIGYQQYLVPIYWYQPYWYLLTKYRHYKTASVFGYINILAAFVGINDAYIPCSSFRLQTILIFWLLFHLHILPVPPAWTQHLCGTTHLDLSPDCYWLFWLLFHWYYRCIYSLLLLQTLGYIDILTTFHWY